MKFLITIKDIMLIKGYVTYNAAQKEHKAIRDALGLGKHLTVRQYCEFEHLPFAEVMAYLTGDSPHPKRGL